MPTLIHLYSMLLINIHCLIRRTKNLYNTATPFHLLYKNVSRQAFSRINLTSKWCRGEAQLAATIAIDSLLMLSTNADRIYAHLRLNKYRLSAWWADDSIALMSWLMRMMTYCLSRLLLYIRVFLWCCITIMILSSRPAVTVHLRYGTEWLSSCRRISDLMTKH